jgi:hypothetical protein
MRAERSLLPPGAGCQRASARSVCCLAETGPKGRVCRVSALRAVRRGRRVHPRPFLGCLELRHYRFFQRFPGLPAMMRVRANSCRAFRTEDAS